MLRDVLFCLSNGCTRKHLSNLRQEGVQRMSSRLSGPLNSGTSYKRSRTQQIGELFTDGEALLHDEPIHVETLSLASEEEQCEESIIEQNDAEIDRTPRIGRRTIIARSSIPNGSCPERRIENCRFYTSNAFDLVQRLKSRRPIVTFSKSLDELLGKQT